MRSYVIATASTCDLDRSWLDEHKIPMISYTCEADGKVYIDDCRPETKRTIFRLMRDGILPNTSQITTYTYYEFFRELLSEGKPVLYIDMDRAISSSFFNAERAAEQIKEEMPDAKLYLMDSCCITGGLSLLLKEMVRMADQGTSYEDLIAWGEANKMRVCHRFLVDDLQWLRRGGRLSNASAIVGSLLSIKPLIYVDNNGKLIAFNKVRGKKKAMRELLESTSHDIGNPAGKDIIVMHSDCPEEAEKWKEMVSEKYPEAASVTIQELGPVIGCHVGPGFLAVVYFTESNERIG